MSEVYKFQNGIHLFNMAEKLDDEEYSNFGMGIVDFFHKSICKEMSKSAIRREMKQGSLKINDIVIRNEGARIALDKFSFNDCIGWIIIFKDNL